MNDTEADMPCCQDDQRSCCVFANVLDCIGDKWSLLLIRDMIFLGKVEYGEFLNSPEGIATNILASRLKGLVDSGMASKIKHPNDGKKNLYLLTDKGIELLPSLIELALWGNSHLDNTFMPKEFLDKINADKEGFIKESKARIREKRDAYLAEKREG